MGQIKRARARRRDVEQVHEDLESAASVERLQNQPVDEDKPGLGQFYCIPCARYFATPASKTSHERHKLHKRRVRMLKEPPYTQQEADFAGGLGSLAALQATVARRQLAPTMTEETMMHVDSP